MNVINSRTAPALNLDTRQLRAFVAVAELGSFTAAAHRVHLSQPALSLLVKQLEESLQLRLFHRSTRKVELTAAGRQWQTTALRVLAELEGGVAGLRELSDRSRGHVTVAALPSVAATLLPPLLAEFGAAFPNVRVSVRDALAEPVIAAVRSGEVDFGIGLALRTESDLLVSRLMMDELVAVCAQRDALARQAQVAWKDLAAYPLIVMARGTSVRQLMDQAFANNAVAPSLAYEVSFMTTAVALAEAGLGVAILPSATLPTLLNPSVARLRIVRPTVKRPISLLQKKGRFLSPAAESLVRHLSQRVQVAGGRRGRAAPAKAA